MLSPQKRGAVRVASCMRRGCIVRGTEPDQVKTACWVVGSGDRTGSPSVVDLQAVMHCPVVQLILQSVLQVTKVTHSSHMCWRLTHHYEDIAPGGGETKQNHGQPMLCFGYWTLLANVPETL